MVANLKITPDLASTNAPVRITARIINRGGAGTYKAVLTIDEIENNSKSIEIGKSSVSDVEFSLTLSKMGRYNVGIGDKKATLLVSDCSQKIPYTLKYDESGMREDSFYGVGNLGQMTRFTPPSIPFTIQKIALYARAVVDNDAELDQHSATINLWDNKHSKMWTRDYSWRLFFGDSTWKEFEVSNIGVTDDFYVEFVSHSEEVKIREVSGIGGRGGGATARVTCVSLGWVSVTTMSPIDIPKDPLVLEQ